MYALGICPDTGAIYEGDTGSGTRLIPAPQVSPASFHCSDLKEFEIPKRSNPPKIIFREDYFDPITRIRRGRFYSSSNYTQPGNWSINDPHRTDLRVRKWRDGVAQEANLYTFAGFPLEPIFRDSGGAHKTTVIIGSEPHFTTWKIISTEVTFFRETLVTLKSYRSLGVLPDIEHEKVPLDIRGPLLESIEGIENSVDRLGPIDVVDRCRATLSIIFGSLCGSLEKDLAKAISAYMNREMKGQDNLSTWAAKIVGRLHSRGKPNEQFRYSSGPTTEMEAQLAVNCVAAVLSGTGWTKC
mgnify:CR=1 FL=1